jgi:MYXO-CTERM domain-containing protein
MGPGELITLGADVLPSVAGPAPVGGGAPIVAPPIQFGALNDFVVTRLHARYSKDALGDDLFFRAAPPIVGGREFVQTAGKLEQGARSDSANNFQARYVIRHPWTGPIACKNPQRGMWGGPPNGGEPGVKPAAKIGFVPRGAAVTMQAFVRGALPPESFLSSGGATPVLAFPATTATLLDAGAAAASDLDAALAAPTPTDTAPPLPTTAPPQGGCAGCTMGTTDASSAGAIAVLLGIALARLRRKKG